MVVKKSTLKRLLILAFAMVYFVPQLHAQLLGGLLTENKTLSAALNPYVVYEKVIVPEGITLTINPGVVLQFSVETSIHVEGGVLLAKGTVDQPIIMRPSDEGKYWFGIHFNNAQTLFDDNGEYHSGSIFQNVSLRGADRGLVLDDSSVLLAKGVKIEQCRDIGIQLQQNSILRITESVIDLCDRGMSLSDTSSVLAQRLTIKSGSYGMYLLSNSSIKINQSTIDNFSYGIYITNNSNYNEIMGCTVSNCGFGILFPADIISRYNLIENNLFTQNGNVALFIASSPSGIQYNKIRNNTLVYNNIGLHIGNGEITDAGYNLITDNILKYNDIGIKLSQKADTIANNLVENNRLGIVVNRASGGVINENIIKGNYEWGIAISEDSNNNSIEYNNISENKAGIKIHYSNVSTVESVNNKFHYNLFANNENETFLIESGPQNSIEFNHILSENETSVVVNTTPVTVMAPNNYWGTLDTLLISSRIIDIYDNPEYGEVIFKPILSIPNPDAPITKPINVIKRLINNEVVVTWNHNQETDLAGYKVYYGVDQEIVIDNLMDTVISISGILLTELIKVTAYDTAANGLKDQFEGHESDYAIAIAGPYAGGDSYICSDGNFFTSQATAIDYLSLNWSTEGDGVFANATTLHTYYVPGEQDIESGYVYISISIESIAGITLNDKIKVTILDYPVLEAGNDTTISQTLVYTTQSAVALNYTSLNWMSSGDGTFENADSLVATYTPGQLDKETGWVELTLVLNSGCGIINDKLKLTLIPSFNIEGVVRINATPVNGAIVMAYLKESGSTRAIAYTTSGADGSFKVENVNSGDYYIHAIPEPNLYNEQVPTYYATRRFWQDAHLMPVDFNVMGVDIDLNKTDFILPEGEGTINGHFVYEGEMQSDFHLFDQPWFEYTEPLPGGTPDDLVPAANHVVFLMNPELNKIIGWCLSGLDGSFTFEMLPYGAYRLWGEKPGFTNSVSPVIYITPENHSINDVELTVNSQYKIIDAKTPSVPRVEKSAVYPNPAVDQIRIHALGFEDELMVDLQIIDERGMKIINRQVNRIHEANFGPIDISSLNNGLYLCVITSSSGVQKVMKLTVRK